ncbi:MAG: hypothetical protein Fur0042_00360 [Cyanophyceae cyanobacterium]
MDYLVDESAALGFIRSLNESSQRIEAKLSGEIAQSSNQVLSQIGALNDAGMRRQCVYLGNNRVLTRLVDGEKFFVDTDDLSLAPHIILDGFWENWISRIFKALIKPGMTVVDVGANIGYYGVVAGSCVGKEGRVFAFEANPKVFDTLFRNISINGYLDRTVSENCAVYSHDTNLTFNTYKYHQGSSCIGTVTEEHLAKYRDEVVQIQVPALALDGFFARGGHDERVDVMKIDVEGAEPYVFRGMERILARNPQIFIFCEFAPVMISGTGGNPQEFLESLLQRGFKLRYIHESSQVIDTSIQELLAMPWAELLLHRN